MDDEEIMRTLIQSMLEQAGYRVYLAENGDEAIGCYVEAQKCGYPFDAVIIDLYVAHGEGGKETIKKLLEIDPCVRAIVTSGATGDPAVTEFRTFGFRGVLAKPFTSDALEQTVRAVING